MRFRPETVSAFEELFADRKERIRHFDGCMHLELWQDAKDPQIFFTYSHWMSEKHLDHYRFSPFFKETWGMTKALFESGPQAWSVNSRVTVQ